MNVLLVSLFFAVKECLHSRKTISVSTSYKPALAIPSLPGRQHRMPPTGPADLLLPHGLRVHGDAVRGPYDTEQPNGRSTRRATVIFNEAHQRHRCQVDQTSGKEVSLCFQDNGCMSVIRVFDCNIT